ncbi:deoxyribodipyrimidine photo-lyase [Babesia caballi]|uniref:Deoxyribodipyrimidine photo-lyase n=1 Tax=Babesia caballi TaxID=5871 RepID=A0AAV4LMS8_BABCB|nr:deoxyribodipyrimidine photo-lyase [Babesia caballi]
MRSFTGTDRLPALVAGEVDVVLVQVPGVGRHESARDDTAELGRDVGCDAGGDDGQGDVAEQEDCVDLPHGDVEEDDAAELLDGEAIQGRVGLHGLGVDDGELGMGFQFERRDGHGEVVVEFGQVACPLVDALGLLSVNVPSVEQDVVLLEGDGEVFLVVAIGGPHVQQHHAFRRHQAAVGERDHPLDLLVPIVDRLKDVLAATGLHLRERGVASAIVEEVGEHEGFPANLFLDNCDLAEEFGEGDVSEVALDRDVNEDV